MAKENEKKGSKFEEKRKAAEKTKQELNDKIEELREEILKQSDEKAKEKLRKEREELISRRNGIVITDEKVKVPMGKKAKKTLRVWIIIIVIIALLFTYVATGAARHGFISTLGWPQNSFTGLVLTDSNGKKHSIKAVTYNYYYSTAYNNLEQQQSYLAQLTSSSGSSSSSDDIDFDEPLSKQTTTDDDGKKVTWAKRLHDQVMDSIKEHYSLYYAAVDANNGKEPDITESQQKEIDDILDQYKDTAKENGFTLDAYLSAAISYGVDSKVLEHEEKVKYIADNYSEDYKFTDMEYNDYLKNHKDDLMGVDVKYFEASSEDDAKAFVKALKDDGSNFTDLASKYADEDWDKSANKEENNVTYYNLTRSNLQGMGGAIGTADSSDSSSDSDDAKYSGLDWLYSSDRKAGDKRNYSTSVVYVIKPAYLYEGNTVTVRHILIQPQSEKSDDSSSSSSSDSDSDTEDINASEATSDQLKAAKKKADSVLEEYNKGEKTAESFGELAKKYSSDSNADDGGIYEDIATNTMVPVFNNWCFDSSRKPGDTTIVLSSYGYHIIYFEETTDDLNWHKLADTELSADDSDSSLNNIKEKAKLKTSFLGSRYFIKDTDLS